MLTISNLSKTYANGVRALNDYAERLTRAALRELWGVVSSANPR